MNKSIKKLFVLLTITLLILNISFAQNTNSNTTSKGKIVIVVLDVSGSIKKSSQILQRLLIGLL